MGCAFTICDTMRLTELAESQTSDQTIMSIAGNVSSKMLAHYSHVRLDAKRKALAALSGWAEAGGYGNQLDRILFHSAGTGQAASAVTAQR